jgi:DNA mismatch endonuclease (patch repair protein)
MDKLDPTRRSENMRRIRSKDMKPELVVRSLVHQLGFRFRLHRRELPGSPDLVFPRHRKIVFVHGCFWHQHSGCREGRVPNTRKEYWEPKLSRNRERDQTSLAALSQSGWSTLVVWECETKDTEALASRLRAFLGPATSVRRRPGRAVASARKRRSAR